MFYYQYTLKTWTISMWYMFGISYNIVCSWHINITFNICPLPPWADTHMSIWIHWPITWITRFHPQKASWLWMLLIHFHCRWADSIICCWMSYADVLFIFAIEIHDSMSINCVMVHYSTCYYLKIIVIYCWKWIWHARCEVVDNLPHVMKLQ